MSHIHGTKESFCEGQIHLGLGRLQGAPHPLWDRTLILEMVARLSRIQLQVFLLNSAAPRGLAEGSWEPNLVENGQWR